MQTDGALTQHAHGLDAADHPDHAVEAAALRHGVGVRAGHEHRPPARPLSPEHPDDIAGRVNVGLEPGGLHHGRDRLPGVAIGLAEDSSRPAGAVLTDGSESGEVGG
jgi:hypothetical protein